MSMLTQHQATVLTGYTGILMCDFSEFHGDVEKRLGRPVWTHEFGKEEMTEEVKEAYKEDFFAMLNRKEE